MNPPPPNNNDNDNEDAAAAAAIIPLVEDGHDDEDDEEEEGGIGSDEDGEEDNIEDDNFGPPVPEDHHSDDDDEDDDEGGNNDEDNGVDVNNEDENNGDEDADADDDFIDDPVENERICQEAMSILLNRLNFPSPQRDRAIVRFAQQFITNVKEDIHKTLTDMRTLNEGYDGLDSDRDTEAEVETAIRCDPSVLTRRDDQFGLYPIQCVWFTQIDDNTKLVVCNVKAASFVHLFVMLAIEFNSFQDEERGGLLVEDTRGYNVLQDLARASLPSSYDEEHQRHVDTTCVAVLIRLRRSGYLVKKDIQKYELVHKLCRHRYISEQRFCFLIKWDPSALLQPNANNKLPLHWVADNLEDFQFVLDLLFRFYPRWKGINALFTIDNDGDTPFELACDKLTQNKVTEVVEEILIRYTTNNGLVNTNYSSNGNALILAAIDDTVSLDGVYFIIRRQPDTMLSMLHHPREEEDEDEDEDEESKTIVSSLSLSNSNNNSNNSIAHRNNNNNQHTTDSSTANDNHGTEDGHHNENKSNNGNDISNGGNASSNNNHNNGIVSRIIRKRKRN